MSQRYQLSALIASSVAWVDLSPERSPLKNQGIGGSQRFPRGEAARFLACCEGTGCERAAKPAPESSGEVISRYRWKRTKSLISLRHARDSPNSPAASQAKSDSFGRFYHF